MGRERQGRREFRRMTEPNLTPLIDLTFLLLITFIITFPMLEQGISIRLPRAKTDKIEQNKSQSITVAVDGKVYLNNREISLSSLEEEMKKVAEMKDPPAVLVRCDERVEYGALMKTLKILNNCHVTRMALVTEPAE
jgi:biopolymer transport protein TolR